MSPLDRSAMGSKALRAVCCCSFVAGRLLSVFFAKVERSATSASASAAYPFRASCSSPSAVLNAVFELVMQPVLACWKSREIVTCHILNFKIGLKQKKV